MLWSHTEWQTDYCASEIRGIQLSAHSQNQERAGQLRMHRILKDLPESVLRQLESEDPIRHNVRVCLWHVDNGLMRWLKKKGWKREDR